VAGVDDVHEHHDLLPRRVDEDVPGLVVVAAIVELQRLSPHGQSVVLVERDRWKRTAWIGAFGQQRSGIAVRDGRRTFGEQARPADIVQVLVAVDDVRDGLVAKYPLSGDMDGTSDAACAARVSQKISMPSTAIPAAMSPIMRRRPRVRRGRDASALPPPSPDTGHLPAPTCGAVRRIRPW
jgi:hypothetical protein